MGRRWSAATLIASTLLVLGTVGCAKEDLTAALSPARNIAGTWRTAFPVRFYYQTDFCGVAKETVGYADWNVTFVITKTSDENVVNVEMSATNAGSFQRTPSSCGSGSTGYIPSVWPTTLRGTISSTSLVATKSSWGMSYDGSFTTDLMMGTWNHWECLIYCFGEYTETNQLKLTRQ
ncbi:MAG: hypothetical protein H3C62_12490 [Gemmatimonadaceae bacterium]|nr:hypothetical protein [Gemmatimonadaceae bacterium]